MVQGVGETFVSPQPTCLQAEETQVMVRAGNHSQGLLAFEVFRALLQQGEEPQQTPYSLAGRQWGKFLMRTMVHDPSLQLNSVSALPQRTPSAFTTMDNSTSSRVWSHVTPSP